MSVSFCLPHPVAVIAFMICSGLCACTEMLWMCMLYVSFGSKVRPRTFGCVLSPPSAPPSWSGEKDVHFCISILLHCRPPCTKSILITCCIQILARCCIRIFVTCCIRILVTCLFESSSHVILESIINHIHKKSVMTGNRHNIISAYKCRITSRGMPDSTIKSSKDI